MNTIKIEKRKITDIKPYWKNPRKNNQTIRAVKQSIEKYGYVAPIIIDEDNIIICGHARYSALLAIKEYQEIDCIIADLSPQQAKQYRILDNKISELTDWDSNLLISELRDMDDIEIFNDFFPDITNLIKIDNIDFEKVSNDNIEKISQEMDDKFRDKKKKYIELSCPECGKQFNILLDDILEGK